jgi:hypothetical protein
MFKVHRWMFYVSHCSTPLHTTVAIFNPGISAIVAENFPHNSAHSACFRIKFLFFPSDPTGCFQDWHTDLHVFAFLYQITSHHLSLPQITSDHLTSPHLFSHKKIYFFSRKGAKRFRNTAHQHARHHQLVAYLLANSGG